MTNSKQTNDDQKQIISAYSKKIQCDLFCDPAEDKTKQAFAQECDINVIMARYIQTGIIQNGNTQAARYADCSSYDFQASHNLVIVAQTMFDSLPAKIRSKFDNSAYEFLNWMENPENKKEALQMGLLPPEEVLAPLSSTEPLKVPPAPSESSEKGADDGH